MGSTGPRDSQGEAFTRRKQPGNDSPRTGKHREGRKKLLAQPQLSLLEVLFYVLNNCTVLILWITLTGNLCRISR